MTYHPRDKAQALTVATQAERKAYVQKWIAKRQKLAAGGMITTAALVLPLVAEAQADQGFVDASGIAGVRSASITADGSAQLVLTDGRMIMVGAADVRTGPDGSVQISSAAAEMVEDVIGAEAAPDVGAPGGAAIAAGILGAGALAAAASSSSSGDPAPAPAPEPDPVGINLSTIATQTRVSELFGTRPSSDATSLTVTVGEGDEAVELAGFLDGNQIWRIPGQDPATFAGVQGEQPISFVAFDDEGEEVDSGSATANIDTIAPTIAIDTPITADDVLNAEELGQPLTISGTTDAEDGQEVTVTVNGIAFTTMVEDGAWSVTLSADDLADLDLQSGETIAVTADVADAAGNPAMQAMASFDTDFVAEIGITEPIAGGELTSLDTFSDLQISGTSNGIEEGREVTVTFAGQTYMGMIGADGAWSVTVPQADLEALDDEITMVEISATASDEAGNTATDSADLPADLSLIPVTITEPDADTTLDAAAVAAGLDVAGTAAPDSTVTVTLDGVEKTTTASAGGNWSVSYEPDELPGDGAATISASAVLEGNPVGEASVGITVDTAPAVMLQAPAADLVIDLEAAESDLEVSGMVRNIADGETVEIELRDADGVISTLTPVIADGAFSGSFAADILSGLADESAFEIVATAAGATDTTSVTTDFQPIITIELPDDGVVDANDLDPNDESVNGTTRGIEEGQSVTVEFEDAEGNTLFSGEATVQADGRFELPLPADFVNGLAPGQTVNIRASGSNEAGREAETFEGSVLIYGEAQFLMTSGAVEDSAVRVTVLFDPRGELPADGGVSLGETLTFDPSQISFAGGVSRDPGLLPPQIDSSQVDDGRLVLGSIGFVDVDEFSDDPFTPGRDQLVSFRMNIEDDSSVIRLDMASQGAGSYAHFLGTDGDDSIEAVAGIDSVLRGRGGDDMIDMSAPGVHSVIFEVGSVANGSDTVLGFDLGGVTPDRIGVTGELPAGARGDSTDFQVTSGGAVGENVGFLVFTTALADLSVDSFTGILDELTGINNGDIMFVLASDGTDAALMGVGLNAEGEALANASGVPHAVFEGLGDLSGFSAANILGFEAHTT